MDEKQEHNLLQTYITDPGRFISTAFRRASTQEPLWFYETLVWEWSRAEKETGKLIHSEDSGRRPKTAYERHAELVRLAIAGEPFEEIDG